MIQIDQKKISPGKESELLQIIAQDLRIKPEQIKDLTILKKSVDARKKPDVFYRYSILLSLDEPIEKKILRKNKTVKEAEKPVSYEICRLTQKSTENPPVIVGMGPAGLFCAYVLAKAGLKPIIIERGEPVGERMQKVDEFWKSGKLNAESNVQFGEGGAGTFSDGKLNTGVKDKFGRKRFVLETFVKHGAAEAILYDAKPHIGTDVLCKVIANMRAELKSLGATILFHHRFEHVIMDANGYISGLKVTNLTTDEEVNIAASRVVLAIGHSARDTFFNLLTDGIVMEQKSFAVGLRVIHEQNYINQEQYGADYRNRYNNTLPPSPYKVVMNTPEGRGVYSFCMCPGGYVVNASSVPGKLCVNGMSYANRGGKYANSAIVVSVSAKDFEGDDPLAGVRFQEKLERSAYQLGKGKIPVEFYEDFRNATETEDEYALPEGIKGQSVYAPLHTLFSKDIYRAFIDGMERFNQQMKGFSDQNPLLCGVESRTSSPVKMPREESMHALSHPGLYPCGEGAGYAGGIMSAAMDGMKVAEAILKEM